MILGYKLAMILPTLFGPNEIFLQDGQLKLDIRGLVYKPTIRMEGDRIIVEVGSDGVLESA